MPGRLYSSSTPAVKPKGRLYATPDSFVDEKSVGGFFGNVIKSGGEFGKSIASAVRHPIQTGKAVIDIAKGGASKLIPGRQESEDTFDAAVGFYKQRYGGTQNIKDTIYNDPVGFLADVATVLTVGAS